jgi:hypothetical protein
MPEQITDSGDSSRPFEVDGSTFVGQPLNRWTLAIEACLRLIRKFRQVSQTQRAGHATTNTTPAQT